MVVARRDIYAAREPIPMDRELFKRLLTEHGTTASKVAREIGVSRMTIPRWLDGTATPFLTTARALASRLDTTVEELWPSRKDER